MKEFVPLSVLMEAIGDTIYGTFGNRRFRIIAEITDIKIYFQRQYAFLTLIEKNGNTINASAPAVIWKDSFHVIRDFEKSTGITLSQNLELVLEVEIQFHSRYGLRISVISIDESFTLGRLEQDKQAVLDGLLKNFPELIWIRDGEYRTANQILKLPLVIQNIALIAAPGSDGRRDFLHELQNNEYGIAYLIDEYPTQVQGESAAGQMASQIAKINSQPKKYDLIAIVRGGGGQTDFSAFDSEILATSILQSEVPVFCGIGHERNVSIADLMCHTSHKTPTKCASGITEHNLEFLRFLQSTSNQLISSAYLMIERFRRDLENIHQNLFRAVHYRIDSEKQWLIHQRAQIELLLPLKVLKKGFTLIYKNKHHIPKGSMLNKGDDIEIRFQDITLNARINER